MYGNKKGMGDSNFSPIPVFRPSHCPSPRISNAASPRQVIIMTTTRHKDVAMIGYNPPTQAFPLHHLCGEFQSFEV